MTSSRRARQLLATLGFFLVASMASGQSFNSAWQRVLDYDDHLAAERANLETQTSLSEAAEDISLPRVDINGAYVQMADPIQIDIMDLEPLASVPSAITSLPGLANIPTVTNLTDDNIATISLQAIWPIYTGGKITAAQEIARAELRASQAMYRVALYERFQLLVDRYYGNQLAQQIVALQQQMVEGVENHRDAALALESQGQIARVERLAAEVALDDVSTARSRAQSQLSLSTLALTQLMHGAPDRLTSNLFVDVELRTRSEYVAQTLESFPGLQVLDAKLSQSESALDIENSEYRPKVFLFGDYQAYENDSILADSIPDWQVGIGVSIPLFDNSGRSSRAQAAENVRREVESLVRQARTDLQLLVSQAFEQASQAKLEYRRLDTALMLADENLHLRQQSFREGFGTSRDVVDALTYRTSVETRRALVAFEFVRHYAQLCVLSGRIDEFLQQSERS